MHSYFVLFFKNDGQKCYAVALWCSSSHWFFVLHCIHEPAYYAMKMSAGRRTITNALLRLRLTVLYLNFEPDTNSVTCEDKP